MIPMRFGRVSRNIVHMYNFLFLIINIMTPYIIHGTYIKKTSVTTCKIMHYQLIFQYFHKKNNHIIIHPKINLPTNHILT